MVTAVSVHTVNITRHHLISSNVKFSGRTTLMAAVKDLMVDTNDS